MALKIIGSYQTGIITPTHTNAIAPIGLRFISKMCLPDWVALYLFTFATQTLQTLRLDTARRSSSIEHHAETQTDEWHPVAAVAESCWPLSLMRSSYTKVQGALTFVLSCVFIVIPMDQIVFDLSFVYFIPDVYVSACHQKGRSEKRLIFRFA